MFKTKRIKFNLTDRGRKHSGIPRNYNVRAICDAINSPETQERVETRGMIGLYGHWARMRFGLDTAEGGVAQGKAISLEPAFITTYLKAQYDGTIEHEEEFLDTESGMLSAKLFQQKVGGFSTAISGLDTAKPRYCGADYVLEPNFIGNSFRGEAFDSAVGTDFTLDSIIQHERDEIIDGYKRLLSLAVSNEHEAKVALDNIRLENEHLLSMLSAEQRDTVFDSINDLAVPLAIGKGAMDRMLDDASFFDNQSLSAIKKTDIIPANIEEGYNLFAKRFLR